MTNLGASLGTALVGAVLISSLTASLIHGINTNEAIPEASRASATVQLESGVPFISDSDAAKQLSASGVPDDVAAQVLAENSSARLDALRSALWVAALVSVLALFFTGLVPDVAIGRRRDDGSPGPCSATATPAPGDFWGSGRRARNRSLAAERRSRRRPTCRRWRRGAHASGDRR